MPIPQRILAMRLTLIAAGLLTLPLLAACEPASTPSEATMTTSDGAAATAPERPARAPTGATARASLVNGAGGSAGTATFRQGPLGVLIRVEATGLTPGWHGLHLHGVGQCEGPTFESAGSHVQHGAEAVPHGLLNADGNDAGDLPNLYAGADGRGFAEVFTTTASLVQGGPGEYLLDADGAAILIHAGPDDHASQPIGGSGDRVICGVVAAG
jgi:Cu-Zn family superoxide dismutase